jgi:hypothetical protein
MQQFVEAVPDENADLHYKNENGKKQRVHQKAQSSLNLYRGDY